MQNPLLKNHRLLLFYIGWFLINIIQAASTELLDDEAYYWLYSRFLDWDILITLPWWPRLSKRVTAFFITNWGYA
jgi:hypothetical protein